MGFSLRRLGSGITDFVDSRINNVKNNARAVGRQLNPFDGGDTFSVDYVTPAKKPAPRKYPTIDLNQPTPYIGKDNTPVGIGKRGTVFERYNPATGWGPVLYDPYGKDRKTEYGDSAYLRLAPHFKEYQEIQPMEYVSSTEQINRILGR